LIGSRIIFYETVESTMDVAKSLAKSTSEDGLVIVSKIQTKGRGRYGRYWKSSLGGLWFSVILREKIDPKKLGLVSIVFSLAVCEILRELGLDSWIKWPNDVLVGNKKIAGILVETSFRGSELKFIIVGVGVNINNSFIEDKTLSEIATSYYDLTKRKYDILQFLEKLLKRINSYWYKFLKDSNVIIEHLKSNTLMLGKIVDIRTAEGTYQGKCIGFGPFGELLIREETGKIINIKDAEKVILVNF